MKTEREIQAEIVKYLKSLQDTFDLKFTVTDASGNPRCRRRKVATGWPDVTVFLPGGRAWGIECKAPGGKLRPEQQSFQSWCNENHVLYTVAYSLSDVMAVRWWQ